MSKKQYDTNSNDPANNDKPFSGINTEKDADQSRYDGPEGESDGLLPDSRRTNRILIHDYEKITGNRWKDMIPVILLLIVGFYCIHTWNTPKNESVIVWQDSEYTTTAEQEYGLSGNTSGPPDPGSTPRTQYKGNLIYNSNSVLHQEKQPVNNNILNYYKKDPVMVLDKITLPEKLTSSASEASIVKLPVYLENNNMEESLVNSDTLFKYRLYKTSNSDNRIGFNFLRNIDLNNLNTNGSNNCALGRDRYERSGFLTDTSKLILIKNKHFLENRILLLNTYVQEYIKTDIHVEKDKILFLSCHGTVSSADCNLTFGPEGLNSIPESPDCGRLIKNLPLGALLYRLSDQEEWKMYANPQSRIIAEKDGVLEFIVNYKMLRENALSGKFAVSVFSNQ